MAIRGTSLSNIDDIHQDVLIFLDKLESGSRFKALNRRLHDLINNYHGYRIVLVGHSLGGSLATALLDQNIDDVAEIFIFNPGVSIGQAYKGIKDHIMGKFFKSRRIALMKAKTHIYHVVGDPISFLSRFQVGQHHNSLSEEVSPHAMANFTDVKGGSLLFFDVDEPNESATDYVISLDSTMLKTETDKCRQLLDDEFISEENCTPIKYKAELSNVMSKFRLPPYDNRDVSARVPPLQPDYQILNMRALGEAIPSNIHPQADVFLKSLPIHVRSDVPVSPDGTVDFESFSPMYDVQTLQELIYQYSHSTRNNLIISLRKRRIIPSSSERKWNLVKLAVDTHHLEISPALVKHYQETGEKISLVKPGHSDHY